MTVPPSPRPAVILSAAKDLLFRPVVILSAAKDLLFALALFLSPAALAAQAPPATDIFLAPLATQNGQLVVGKPLNITARPGYDNQPSFTPDGRAILFTSIHDDAQADIYRYDLAAAAVSRVTSTPESEYSATVMPGGKRFSVIRVERDSTQRLWSFAMDGSDPRVLIETLKPVGYHAWLDSATLAMFVLGRPNALVIGNLRTGRMDTVARGIGRSLAPLPQGLGFSFTQASDSITHVRGMDPRARRTWDIGALPRGSEDLAWSAEGTVIVGAGSRLLALRRGERQWADIGDLAGSGVSRISRIAVSPDGKWIAIVAVPSGAR